MSVDRFLWTSAAAVAVALASVGTVALSGSALLGVAVVGSGVGLGLWAWAAGSRASRVGSRRAGRRRGGRRPRGGWVSAAPVGEDRADTHVAWVGHSADQLLAVAPDLMSDRELCLAWRVSYWALRGRGADPANAVIIEARQAYLDELERRDPDGFTCWLRDGARAGSDPGRYVGTGAPGGSRNSRGR